MEQDKVIIKMNFCINPMMAEHIHIGGEFSIKEGQTQEQAWAEHIGRVENFYKENFQKESSEMRGTQVRVIDPAPIHNISEEMEACTELDNEAGTGLLSYKWVIKNDSEKAVYDRKLSELTLKNK